MKKFKTFIIGLGILLLIVSCHTYSIPIDSFRSQMAKENTEIMNNGIISNPLTNGNTIYSSDHIVTLKVIDKNGNELTFGRMSMLELKITHRNGKKYRFYSETMFLQNDTLKGGRYRFMGGRIKQIPLDSIAKIIVKDFGKQG